MDSPSSEWLRLSVHVRPRVMKLINNLHLVISLSRSLATCIDRELARRTFLHPTRLLILVRHAARCYTSAVAIQAAKQLIGRDAHHSSIAFDRQSRQTSNWRRATRRCLPERSHFHQSSCRYVFELLWILIGHRLADECGWMVSHRPMRSIYTCACAPLH